MIKYTKFRKKGAARVIAVSCVLALAVLAFCKASASAEPLTKSGYALGQGRCGTGALTFPKLPIGMMEGFCAGLVASQDDGLKFPRSIVQIPGRDQFVVTDMGGWNTKEGRLLVLDPHKAEGSRITEAIVNLDYPSDWLSGLTPRSTHRPQKRFSGSIRLLEQLDRNHHQRSSGAPHDAFRRN